MLKQTLLFIHRSVGQNLIRDGELYLLLKKFGQQLELSDFNQNIGTFHHADGASTTPGWQFPGNDTTPADYAALFSKERQAAHDTMLDQILAYDIIAIKSCFPNTRITSESMFRAHQRSYQQIIHFFQKRPGKKLVIITSPPLIPLLTLPSFAKRARKLANWLSQDDFGSNIFVFNLFNELAIPEGNRQANTLRKDYRRHFILDSHPNAHASITIAPKLCDFFLRVAQS